MSERASECVVNVRMWEEVRVHSPKVGNTTVPCSQRRAKEKHIPDDWQAQPRSAWRSCGRGRGRSSLDSTDLIHRFVFNHPPISPSLKHSDSKRGTAQDHIDCLSLQRLHM